MKKIKRSIKNSKLKNSTISLLRNKFQDEVTASRVAIDLELNRHTINRYYKIFRTELIKEEQNRFLSVCNTSKIDYKYFDYNENEIDKIKPSPDAYINIYVVIIKGLVFATVRYDTKEATTQPIFTKKYYIKSYRPFKWNHYSSSSDKKINIFYMLRKVDCTPTRIKYMALLKLFINKFIQARIIHNGIAKNKLYYYLKEVEHRFNHREKLFYDRLE